MGIAWRSTWEVENDIRSGQLVEVLAEFAAPPNGIYGEGAPPCAPCAAAAHATRRARQPGCRRA
jgi:hypothetical protein